MEDLGQSSGLGLEFRPALRGSSHAAPWSMPAYTHIIYQDKQCTGSVGLGFGLDHGRPSGAEGRVHPVLVSLHGLGMNS